MESSFNTLDCKFCEDRDVGLFSSLLYPRSLEQPGYMLGALKKKKLKAKYQPEY